MISNPDDVRTQNHFREFVFYLVKNQLPDYQQSLEEYLLSVWDLLEQRKDQKPTWKLFASLLQDALNAPPAEFNPAWLQFKSHPPRTDENTLPDIEILRGTLRYQIADLHRMRDAGMYEKPSAILWLGQKSPTGNLWYNTLPAIFLKCAARGLGLSDEEKCSWDYLEYFLCEGQYNE